MIVLKFGGTSIRNANWIDKTLDIVLKHIDKSPVLVASAMGKTTDRLQEISGFVRKGQKILANNTIEKIKNEHLKTISEFLTGDIIKKCIKDIETLFAEILAVITGLSLLKECTPRSNDLILSFGERLSTTIIASRAMERGIETRLLDSRNFIKTDTNFTCAAIIEDLTFEKIRDQIKPQKNILFITQGFISSSATGLTTTLGRGGSDYTATILGAALKAEEVQIWTDVDGIMTSDPNIINMACAIPSISYKEAAELSYFGARVIHPSTIQPAIIHNIPVCIKNTGNPKANGTRILGDIPSEGPKSISFKKDVTVINISSARMLLAYGFLKRIFDIFDKYKTPVDIIATSEVSVSITIDNIDSLENIRQELSLLGSVSVEHEKSIICLVGQNLWKDSNIICRVFGALKSIPIRMISLGSSDTNLSFVVPQNLTENTVKKLHKEFFEK